MAITPFFQDQIELEGAEEGMARYAITVNRDG
jgi:hypothetical protein